MKRSLFVPVLWFVAIATWAQAPSLEVISIEQGLSQGFVNALDVDDEGFLWASSNNGLNRYDGYEFQVFKSDPNDPNSLANNNVISLVSVGRFVVAVSPVGILDILDRETRKVYHMRPRYSVDRLVKDGKSGLWMVYAPGDGKNKAVHLEIPENLGAQVANGAAVDAVVQTQPCFNDHIVEDIRPSRDHKKLYGLLNDKIRERDLTTGVETDLALPPGRLAAPRNYLMVDKAGRLFILNTNEIWGFDRTQWHKFDLPIDHPSGLLSQNFQSDTVWYGNKEVVFALNLEHAFENGRIGDPVYRIPLPEEGISVATDPHGNVFIGTDAKGIRKFNPRTALFRNYLLGGSVYSKPLLDRQGNLFVRDIRRKITPFDLFNTRTGQARKLEDLVGMKLNRVLAEIDDKGNYWIVNLNEFRDLPSQLIRFDPATNQKAVFLLPEKFTPEAIKFVPPDQVWMAGTHKLIRFDASSHEFHAFSFTPAAPDMINAQFDVTTMEQTPDGRWWFGPYDATGLGVAEPGGSDTYKLHIIKNIPSDPYSLPSNVVKTICRDPLDPNILWIGTGGGGFSKFDVKTNRFTTFNTRNGLPDDFIYGILADNARPYNLWISMNHGLTRYNPSSGQMQFYSKYDGLQDDEFNTNAFSKGPGDELLFGGVNGLTVFNPKDLTSDNRLPAIQITGIKINGNLASPGDQHALIATDVLFLNQLDLPYAKNNIQLQFAAMDFTHPDRNQFAFYLEGAEPEWAHHGFEHTAQYLNLAPGTYTFYVKGANSNGVWNETPRTLKIVIHPPWYQSWWAYLFYMLAAAGFGYWMYRLQLKRRLDQAETERLKGLDQFKSRFFTNITHEFRTPLTVILGATDQLDNGAGQWVMPTQKDVVQNKLSLIKRNSENLLRLINQILDLAKLENNTLKINYIQGDVLAFFRYVSESLHSLASANNLTLRVESDQARIVMDYDPERLLQIVHNLLLNAIKFTPSGGRVAIHAEKDGEWLLFRVVDTGVGIPENDLPHLFDRFFQARNQEHAKAGGTGIGLSLTRELVRAMGGSIEVESPVKESGIGTAFSVRLPVTNKAETGVFLPGEQLKSGLPAKPAAQSLRPVDLQTRPLLLLVEDNPDVMEYLSSCLQSIYRIEYAYNGRAGIDKAIETVPDLIVSDVMMPEKDGFEVCEALKNDERTSHIPIVLLTAKSTVEDRIAGLKHGADAYLAKPFREEELLVWVEQLIARRRLLLQRYANLTQPPVASDAREFTLEDNFIIRMRDALERHYNDADFSVDTICREMAMSRAQVHRKLSALTGRSTTEFINTFRLEKARQFLLSSNLNISEIAFQSGFNDPKYFSRLFSETYGLSPSDFRKRQG